MNALGVWVPKEARRGCLGHLEFQLVLSHPMWMLGTEDEFSGKPRSALHR